MFTTDSKLLFGMAAAALVAAVAYAIGSGGDRVGAITLAGVAIGAVLLGSMFVGRVRPATVEAVAPLPNRTSEPIGSTFWPVLAALAVVLFLVGLTLDPQTIVLGLVAAAVAGAGWFVQTRRDRLPQLDPAALYAEERVVGPAGLPILALVAIGVVVISVSRILLAVSKEASTAIAIAAAAGVFVVAMLISSRSRVNGRVLAGLVGFALVLLAIGGVVAATNGERTFEPEHGKPAVTEVAQGTAFSKKQLTVSTDTGRVIVHFRDKDPFPLIHNMVFYTDQSATKAVYFGAASVGVGEKTYVFSAEPGTYFYRCEFHPTQMTGTLKVERPQHAGEKS